MNCNEGEDLVAWRDGALPPGRSAELAAHVGTCPACAADAAKLERAVAALASLPELPAPGPHLRVRVLAAVAPPAPSLLARLGTWLRAAARPAVLVPALAAAVALVVWAPPGAAPPPATDDVSSALEAEGEPMQVEAALVLDELEQFETLELESPEDAEVVAMLDELEGRP
jgi:anti-sigma factor RsiW